MLRPRPGSGTPGRKTTRIVGRGEAKEAREGRVPPPKAPDSNPAMIYMGVGGGILVLVLLVAVMGGGSEEKKAPAGPTAKVIKSQNQAVEAFNAGRFEEALSILAEVANTPKLRASSRAGDCEKFAAEIRVRIQREKEAKEGLAAL